MVGVVVVVVVGVAVVVAAGIGLVFAVVVREGARVDVIASR